MNTGFQNFSKVALKSATGYTKLATLGLGIVSSLALPQIALLMTPLSIVSVLTMIWADLNNQDFIKQTLSTTTNSNSQTLVGAIYDADILLKTQLKQTNLKSEVTKDLLDARAILEKIKNSSQQIPIVQQGVFGFVADYIPKIIQKIIKLSSQEQVARNYLDKENTQSIQAEIKQLQKEQENCQDEIGKKEYEKAINLKKDQLKLVQNMTSRLQRIDSYLAKLKAGLEQTNAYLTKVSLKDDEFGLMDEGEILTDSLKQITIETEDLQEF